MADEGEGSDKDLAVKKNSTCAIWNDLDSGKTACYKHRHRVKHAEQLHQLPEETNMHTSIFV